MKHRLTLMATYSASLRASEVTALKAEHIDSTRMLIKAEHGKGGTERYTLLSERFSQELRHYYKTIALNSGSFAPPTRAGGYDMGLIPRIHFQREMGFHIIGLTSD